SHGEFCPSLRDGTQRGGVTIHFSQRYFGNYFLKMSLRIYAFYNGATALQVAHYSAGEFIGTKHLYMIDRFQQLRVSLLESLFEGHQPGYFEGNIVAVNRVHLSI